MNIPTNQPLQTIPEAIQMDIPSNPREMLIPPRVIEVFDIEDVELARVERIRKINETTDCIIFLFVILVTISILSLMIGFSL